MKEFKILKNLKMLRNLFKRSNQVSIEEFLLNLRDGDKSILNSLNLNESNFEDASQEELFSNEDDLACGVNRVQKNFDNTFFSQFENMLIKHYDNGDVKYIFYTQTRDTSKIFKISDFLFQEFGHGFFDDRKHTPFREKEKVLSLSQGKYLSNKDELLHLWFVDKYTILLQYRISPMRQFVLSITEKSNKELNQSIRTNGTILDLLKLDVNILLKENEYEKEIKVEEGTIKFIDYFFKLEHLEFDIFDIANLRIFDGDREFRDDVQTHLTLMSSTKIPYEKMIRVSEKLIGIYGEDDSGSKELEIHDMEALEEDYWTGRTWNFNEVHGLWDMDNDNEKMSYSVRIDYDEEDNGYKITILGYNSLWDYFKIKS